MSPPRSSFGANKHERKNRGSRKYSLLFLIFNNFFVEYTDVGNLSLSRDFTNAVDIVTAKPDDQNRITPPDTERTTQTNKHIDQS